MGDVATCPRCGRATFDLYLLRCIRPASECGLVAVNAPAPPSAPAAVAVRPSVRDDEARRARRTGRVWRFEVPLPPREVSQNARVHWSARQRATREYREASAAAYLRAEHPEEPIDLVEVTFTGWICYGAKGDGRSRSDDVPNFLGELKAAIDALQPDTSGIPSGGAGAGVIVSDHREHFRIGGVAIREVGSVEDEAVSIVVRELTR